MAKAKRKRTGTYQVHNKKTGTWVKISGGKIRGNKKGKWAGVPVK